MATIEASPRKTHYQPRRTRQKERERMVERTVKPFQEYAEEHSNGLSANGLSEEVATDNTFGLSTSGSSADSILPNPDSVLRKNGISIATYRELLTDPEVASLLFQRKSRTKRLSYQINTEESESGSLAEEILTPLLKRLKLRKIINGLLDAIAYGYSPAEVLWEERDGYWLPKSVTPKPQEWFAFSRERNLLYKGRVRHQVVRRFNDTPPAEGEVSRKFLCTRHEESYINPYGFPLLSTCFWAVAFKRGGVEFWAYFVEKYGMPWVVAEAPELSGTEEEQAEQLQEYANRLDAMVQDAVIVIEEKGLKTEIVSGGSTASVDIYERWMNWLNKEMAKSILGHTGASENTPGQLGNNDTAGDNIDSLTEDDKAMVEEELETLLMWIWELNFPGQVAPWIELYRRDPSKALNKQTLDRDVILAEKFGVEFTDEYIATTYSLPQGSFTRKPTGGATEAAPTVGATVGSTQE